MKRLLIVLALCITIIGCGNEGFMGAAFSDRKLPAGATDVTDAGNHWIEYNYKGKRLLQYMGMSGHAGYMATVVIGDAE